MSVYFDWSGCFFAEIYTAVFIGTNYVLPDVKNPGLDLLLSL